MEQRQPWTGLPRSGDAGAGFRNAEVLRPHAGPADPSPDGGFSVDIHGGASLKHGRLSMHFDGPGSLAWPGHARGPDETGGAKSAGQLKIDPGGDMTRPRQTDCRAQAAEGEQGRRGRIASDRADALDPDTVDGGVSRAARRLLDAPRDGLGASFIHLRRGVRGATGCTG